jgi:hypothetical protein
MIGRPHLGQESANLLTEFPQSGQITKFEFAIGGGRDGGGAVIFGTNRMVSMPQ